MAEIGKDILKAKALLEAGELVGLPTETVYGLAANALNAKAVAKIFEAKERPSFDPLIIHTDSIQKVKDFVQYIPLDLEVLLKQFSPGPITVLLPKKAIISDLVTSGLERVAVRIPNHPLSLELLRSIDFPLAAPSANPFGYISPTSAQHVENQLGEKLKYILDGGECQVGLESTIIGFENDKLTVYRKGGLSIESIEKVVGKVNLKEHSSSNPAAPGMLKSHYAPKKKVIFIRDFDAHPFDYNPDKVGFLGFCEALPFLKTEQQFLLSPNKDLNEAARNLFKGLRFLDQLDIETVIIELVPEVGLGMAINDRLKRAAAK
ncbi:L-threonylcarbamoyladenylate synthase [Arcticibacterium luteifluviistationis]|uniref:Threonylcarbamoyl-AMP synthase n=1 Tax=Arcticibacterium luteifluviistationis TaxID=1784714 RepID=A0A2Z4GAW7_9BACT|nr:L-threonylcarbamoyladenylate synthase [Arcticibacterium luteifluviistationis]AWV98422.1 threonylcarbamoyl-AMP synthase [Arcticibacterium luteifluviistationis]